MEKIVKEYANRIFKYYDLKGEKSKEYLTMCLQNIYQNGQVDGINQTKKLIWEK